MCVCRVFQSTYCSGMRTHSAGQNWKMGCVSSRPGTGVSVEEEANRETSLQQLNTLDDGSYLANLLALKGSLKGLFFVSFRVMSSRLARFLNFKPVCTQAP